MKRWMVTATCLVATSALGAPPGSAQQGDRLDMMTFERPIEAVDNVWMEELTMLEIRDYMAAGMTTALILTGGVEENGPYLTTGKHNHVLRVMGESIARKLGNTLIPPIVTLEPGDTSRETPGTVVVSRPVYTAFLMDMATSLKSQGFTEIFFLGDSGGNRTAMAAAADVLSDSWRRDGVLVAHIAEFYNYDDVEAYQRDELGVDEDPTLEGLHDDYYITSIIMNDDPEYVRLEQRIAADKASINGISIVPAEKTIEHGKKLIEFRTRATIEGIERARASHGG